ncbi:MAG: hypothetical protein GKR93_04715 [Gammaproteobacteria bacterium]|nr:hypothetical protein [Gammaproteobacteria bacterium]
MTRQAHSGYNADAPETTYYLAMEFNDLQQAEQCWAFIESDDEPVRSIHNAVKQSIKNSSFFLYRDI